MNGLRLECNRVGQPFGYSLGNGDQFDSIITIYISGRKLFTAEYVNTDPSYNFKYFGILAEGNYRWICGRREDRASRPKVLYIYQADFMRDKNIIYNTDLTPADRTLPSIVPNPNHAMKNIITNVLVHNRAITYD